MTEDQKNTLRDLEAEKDRLEAELPDKPSISDMVNFIILFLNTLSGFIGSSITIPEIPNIEVPDDPAADLPDMPNMPGIL